MFAIDHLAFPCFDVPATVRFYVEILGGTLRHAQSGPAPAWNAKEYLLLAVGLPGGVTVDFFSFDGIQRPAADGLPRDIRHVALRVATRADVLAVQERYEAAGVAFWTESHEGADLHLYAADPNGVVVEVLETADTITSRAPNPVAARAVIDAWLAARA